MKAPPMLMPMVAITRVRTSSRDKSAARAMTAAATAPLPCRARPRITPWMVSAPAATTLPRAKINIPPTMTGLRPMRSESSPKGICNSAWVSP